VITYVSRQDWGRRMLREVDHARLVEQLRLLGRRQGWEVNVVSLEKMKREDQIRLAGRTTVCFYIPALLKRRLMEWRHRC
jgi:hypothetical protein